MLCQTCPIRSQCTSPCEELNKDLAKQEVYLRETSIDPEQAKHILESHQEKNDREEVFEESFDPNTDEEHIYHRLYEALQTLSIQEKSCIFFRFWAAYSVAEISDFLEIPKTTVFVCLRRALRQVKAYMTQDRGAV